MDLSPRLRAVCDLDVAVMRENSGRHEYDGKPQDLSPDGVRAGLARLAAARDGGERLADPHDEAHLTAAEDLLQVTFAELEMHRRNPILHLAELELASYDRDYAPAAERAAAWAEHLAAWPRVVDAAIESLDLVSAPVAEALLGAARGLAAGISAGPDAAADGDGAWDTENLAGQRGPGGARGRAGRARAPGRSPGADRGRRQPGPGARRAGAQRADEQRGGAAGRPRPAGRAGRRGAGPAAGPAGRGVRAGGPGPSGPGGSPGTGPGASGRAGRDRRGPAVGAAGHRLHPRARSGPLPRRGLPGGPGARVAPLGDGHDDPGRARRAGRPVLVPHHAAGGILAGRQARGVAGGLQRHDAARHRRARGRSRALLPRPGIAPADLRGPPDRTLQRVRRGVGALRRGTVRGGRLRRRRSPGS